MIMHTQINVDGYLSHSDQTDNTSGAATWKSGRRLQRDAMRRRPLLRGSKRWKQEIRSLRSIAPQRPEIA
jgi:hypothetical protein